MSTEGGVMLGFIVRISLVHSFSGIAFPPYYTLSVSKQTKQTLTQ